MAKSPHPLCPTCGYDLVGTVAARRRTCPECGNDFTPAGPAGTRQWTPWTGVRRVTLTLLWRSVVGGLLCAGLDWLIIPESSSPPYWGMAFVLALAGVALGWSLTFDLSLHAGFASPWLAALAAVFAWAAVLGGMALAWTAWGRPPPDGPAALTLLTIAVFATLWIVKAALFDD